MRQYNYYKRTIGADVKRPEPLDGLEVRRITPPRCSHRRVISYGVFIPD